MLFENKKYLGVALKRAGCIFLKGKRKNIKEKFKVFSQFSWGGGQPGC